MQSRSLVGAAPDIREALALSDIEAVLVSGQVSLLRFEGKKQTSRLLSFSGEYA